MFVQCNDPRLQVDGIKSISEDKNGIVWVAFKYLIEDMEDLDPENMRLVNKHFWELLTDVED